ncbi:MAG TPA: hypothetical protein VGX23_33650 [Actinocrinis sp.]|nr:hypothetical protein [Actinocrinis sp.]
MTLINDAVPIDTANGHTLPPQFEVTPLPAAPDLEDAVPEGFSPRAGGPVAEPDRPAPRESGRPGPVRRVVTHPHTKFAARHAVHVGLGVHVAAKSARDSRTTARHERMMRTAEAAGDHAKALEWEQRAAAFRKERHDRRIALLKAVPHVAKATVIGAGVTMGMLLALGIVLAFAGHDIRAVLGPLMALVDSVRWCVEVFDLLWRPVLWTVPVVVLVALWEAGRRHAAHSNGWVAKLQPQGQDAGIVVSADGIVRALQSLPVAELKRAFKGGWIPAFPLTPVREGRGYHAVIELPMDVTPGMVADQRERLARALHRAPVEVWASDASRKGTGSVGSLDLWVADLGALSRAAPEYPLLNEGTADVFEGVPVGVVPRGDGLLAPIVGNNAVLGGMMGQGKSNACRVLMLGCALDPLAELWVFVLANNGDFDAYEPRLARYRRGATDDVTADALGALRDLYAEVDRREGRLADLGAKKLTRKIAADNEDLRPIIALFSECHELFGHKEFGEEAEDVAVSVMRRARKAGIVLIFDTQQARKGAIPPKVVGLVSVNGCFYVKSWRDNDGFLGDGSFAAGIRATDLRPGVDRGTSLITGVSVELYEILKWYFVEVDDDTGFDAAAEVIARAVANIAPGTRVASNAPEPKPLERRDLLADLVEVLGDEPVPAAQAAKRLAVLAPTWAPYRSLTGPRLVEVLLDDHGVKVPSTSNRYPIDPVAVRSAMARRGVGGS